MIGLVYNLDKLPTSNFVPFHEYETILKHAFWDLETFTILLNIVNLFHHLESLEAEEKSKHEWITFRVSHVTFTLDSEQIYRIGLLNSHSLPNYSLLSNINNFGC